MADRRHIFSEAISAPQWTIRWAIAILSIFFYFLMEWLFFVTKPSFMSVFTSIEAIRILFAAPAPFYLLMTILVLALMGLDYPVSTPTVHKALIWVGRLIPALFFSASLFLVIENFTYTIFKFGLKTIDDSLKWCYFVLYLLLFAYALHFIVKKELSVIRGGHLKKMIPLCILLFSGLLLSLITGQTTSPDKRIESPSLNALPGKRLPNILMLSSDGLNADHTSVYGYSRETTPFLSELSEGRALFCENAFTNASNTGGSVTSTLTGKLPTRTRVYYPPEILRGIDRYEHLPGILRRYGYRNIDISIRQFADAYDMNLQNGFDVANGRELSHESTHPMINALLVPGADYFIATTFERLRNRISYSLGFRNQVDSHDEASGKKRTAAGNDSDRIKQLFSWVDDMTDGPFFAHLHLMDTHGPKFHPRKSVFSKDTEQKQGWMIDFYDDAILDFDNHVRAIVDGLKRRGKYNETIIVIGTDHGFQFNTRVRIPLIFLFPNGSHTRRIKTNAQNLDIGPTLLDYLGIPKPGWMQGQSLLRSDPDRYRPIFSTGVNPDCVNPKKWLVDSSKTGPPFFSLGFVSVSICDNYYRFGTVDRSLIRKKIPGHTSPCADTDFLSKTDSKKIIFKHLTQNGYAF